MQGIVVGAFGREGVGICCTGEGVGDVYGLQECLSVELFSEDVEAVEHEWTGIGEGARMEELAYGEGVAFAFVMGFPCAGACLLRHGYEADGHDGCYGEYESFHVGGLFVFFRQREHSSWS